uniref:Uncharacterized protein n=1 Tax=Arundo donax TaxID=35708 RepID=A0A0A9EYP5_ARUDO
MISQCCCCYLSCVWRINDFLWSFLVINFRQNIQNILPLTLWINSGICIDHINTISRWRHSTRPNCSYNIARIGSPYAHHVWHMAHVNMLDIVQIRVGHRR